MDIREAYNSWAAQYDTNENKTRDLEGQALRLCLADISFDSCLEIGCGTGKNSVWLIGKATHLTAVDLSEEMLGKAQQKLHSGRVRFVQADITGPWTFADRSYDVVTFSLVLEHIQDLDHVFREASRVLREGGFVYAGELHPFKQYSGAKARFDTADGRHVVECFNHHVSDFIQAAKKYDLMPVDINEFFDDNDRTGIPRILTLLLKKVSGADQGV